MDVDERLYHNLLDLLSHEPLHTTARTWAETLRKHLDSTSRWCLVKSGKGEDDEDTETTDQRR